MKVTGLLFLLFPLWVQAYYGSVSRDTVLMGSAFTFTAVHDDPKIAEQAIEAGIAEVIRIEQLISSWSEDSETAQINRNAGMAPVSVSKELYELIGRSKRVSQMTNGYFDISFASIDRVWDFSKDYDELPDPDLITASVQQINYKNIELKESPYTVFLKEKGMKIGFGAIGKGYAANRAMVVMKAKGVESGVVNAGGDLMCWGSKPSEEPWSIGIADPDNKNNIRLWLNTSNLAVVTSGNYEKYVNIQGEQYCHIINPKTGWPVKGIKSVTIICPNAELADALATSVFVLGKNDGIKLINHLQDIEGLIITDDGELHFSDNLKKHYLK